MKRLSVLMLGMAVAVLVACGEEKGAITIPVQHWNETDIRIETHPNPPVAGMSEIVAIVTGPHGRPISDLTISLRSNDAMPWVQAIQDGFIGVYRRAVDVGDTDESVLQVRLQRGAEQKVLFFPLKLTKG